MFVPLPESTSWFANGGIFDVALSSLFMLLFVHGCLLYFVRHPYSSQDLLRSSWQRTRQPKLRCISWAFRRITSTRTNYFRLFLFFLSKETIRGCLQSYCDIKRVSDAQNHDQNCLLRRSESQNRLYIQSVQTGSAKSQGHNIYLNPY